MENQETAKKEIDITLKLHTLFPSKKLRQELCDMSGLQRRGSIKSKLVSEAEKRGLTESDLVKGTDKLFTVNVNGTEISIKQTNSLGRAVDILEQALLKESKSEKEKSKLEKRVQQKPKENENGLRKDFNLYFTLDSKYKYLMKNPNKDFAQKMAIIKNDIIGQLQAQGVSLEEMAAQPNTINILGTSANTILHNTNRKNMVDCLSGFYYNYYLHMKTPKQQEIARQQQKAKLLDVLDDPIQFLDDIRESFGLPRMYEPTKKVTQTLSDIDFSDDTESTTEEFKARKRQEEKENKRKSSNYTYVTSEVTGYKKRVVKKLGGRSIMVYNVAINEQGEKVLVDGKKLKVVSAPPTLSGTKFHLTESSKARFTDIFKRIEAQKALSGTASGSIGIIKKIPTKNLKLKTGMKLTASKTSGATLRAIIDKSKTTASSTKTTVSATTSAETPVRKFKIHTATPIAGMTAKSTGQATATTGPISQKLGKFSIKTATPAPESISEQKVTVSEQKVTAKPAVEEKITANNEQVIAEETTARPTAQTVSQEKIIETQPQATQTKVSGPEKVILNFADSPTAETKNNQTQPASEIESDIFPSFDKVARQQQEQYGRTTLSGAYSKTRRVVELENQLNAQPLPVDAQKKNAILNSISPDSPSVVPVTKLSSTEIDEILLREGVEKTVIESLKNSGMIQRTPRSSTTQSVRRRTNSHSTRQPGTISAGKSTNSVLKTSLTGQFKRPTGASYVNHNHAAKIRMIRESLRQEERQFGKTG